MYKNEKTNEIIENIPEYNLKIIQNNKYFKFGVDTVALAKFAASYKTNSNIVDICSGTGAVGLIYSRLIEQKVSKHKAYRKIQKLFFIEKQDYFADLNKRNIKINNFDFNNYLVLNFDINNKDIINIIPLNSVDIILCNPPYHSFKNTVKSSSGKKAIAKFEEKDFLNDLFSLANKILKSKGEFYMVHRPERLVDLFNISRNYSIEPKIIKFIVSSPLIKPSLVLLKFVKNANSSLRIEDPFLIGRD